MASSSCSASIASPKIYDAFISHRGPDVKETLAKRLYELLHERGCVVFLDRPEIQVGDSITLAIRNGICSSLVQIAIFSPGYANSSWCLDELDLMLKQSDAVFVPVFYNVEPWELRHMKNPKSRYAKAFSVYRSKGMYPDRLHEWEIALQLAADQSGFKLNHSSCFPTCFATCFEWIWPSNLDTLCENIVSHVLQVVKERKNRIPRDVAKYPVGLDERVQKFDKSCSEAERDQKVMIAGIYGLGGSGKTTLAKELFNRKSSAYHASSFLSNVRELDGRGELSRLQSQLIEDLCKIGDPKIRDVDDGIGKLKHNLGRARQWNFLIVLDDVDHLDQIDALLPQGMLSSNSLVIITTRDQSMLRDAHIRYQMKGLNRVQAKDLFCRHAFCGQDPPNGYEALVESFLHYCGGLPLSLKVLGAHLYGREEYYWELELEKVKKIQPKDIMERLKISFNGLDREEKQIFIDIACLFIQPYMKDLISMAKSIWRASGWSAEHALQTLQDKCLVEVNYHAFKFTNESAFVMHDHLCDLGRQMADELGPPRLWRPDILRSLEAKGFQQMLAETKDRCFHSFRDSSPTAMNNFVGSSNDSFETGLLRFIEYLQSFHDSPPTTIKYFVGSSNDSAETDLLLLSFFNYGERPKEIPPWVPLRQLHYLSVRNVIEMWNTFHQQLETNAQASFKLRKLKISHCHGLEKLPDLIAMFSHLEELEIKKSFDKTGILTSLLESIKQLSALTSLRLCSIRSGSKERYSTSLEVQSTSLETIHFQDFEIEKLLVSGEFCPRLQSLTLLYFPNLKTISLLGISSLTWLQHLTVQLCHELETISLLGISSLTWLQYLTVWVCPKLETISGLSSLTWLKVFEVESCGGLKSLPSLAHQSHLEQFTVWGCDKLQSVEGFEKWHRLKSLVIEVPENGYEWVRNCIYGLKMLPSEKIILAGKAADTALSRLDEN